MYSIIAFFNFVAMEERQNKHTTDTLATSKHGGIKTVRVRESVRVLVCACVHMHVCEAS